uniref:RRM domain-containing protein n=1 Tax=Electrophorus electricus TaxID=8005 RepID=A0A4W4HA40_ELEEL
MGDDSLEDRSVEVLDIPDDVEDDFLWLYFESKRSGGGNLISLDRNGDRALLVFEQIEDVKRVLSKDSHTLSNAKLAVRRKPPKDHGKFVLRGLTRNTSLEMVELYVENLTGFDSDNYTLYPSPGKDMILIHLHAPLTEGNYCSDSVVAVFLRLKKSSILFLLLFTFEFFFFECSLLQTFIFISTISCS